jgi:hypothetical protein
MVFKSYASPFAWACFLGILLLLNYFSIVDIYHAHFFSTGLTVFFYNFCRVAFIGNLLWLFYFTGDRVLTYVADKAYSPANTLDSVLLAFFSGVGIWQIVMLVLGLAGFDKHIFLLAITLLMFFISMPTIDRSISTFHSSRVSFYWPGLLMVAVVASFFLLIKGLYPAGGHDYYTHYFHFYRTVTETGRIWPNEVWYHFYYSKGAGLFFLGMLLTDPLAPQLVTTTLIVAGAGIIFSLLRNITPWRFFPWLGVALYLAFLIYTPGPEANMRQGGWGDFEKIHEIVGVLILAIIWMMMRLQQTDLPKSIGIALLLTVSALVIFIPLMTVFVGFYLLLMGVYFFATRKKQAAKWTLLAMLTAGTWVITILIINYLFSGLPDDRLIAMFWPYVDFKAIKSWGVPLELIYLHDVQTILANTQIPFSSSLSLLKNYLRLDVWGSLFGFGLFFAILGFGWQKWHKKCLPSSLVIAFYPILFFLLVVLLLSVILGRAEPISFYRFTTFTYAPTLCLTLLLFAVLIRSRLAGIMLLVFVSAFFIWQYNSTSHLAKKAQLLVLHSTGNCNLDNMSNILENALRFAKGRYSIADAYQNQQGWPGRMPWGGIHPASLEVWKRLPPRTRVWSMHVHTYCMLPDCRMEGFMSYRFSTHPEDVYYGDPRTAKMALKKENLNYFLISHSLPIVDPLPLTPLFSPAHIAENFGIVWTDGDTTLLTWKEDTEMAIDASWLRRYQKQVKASNMVKTFPYLSIQVVLQKLKAEGRLTKADMPWTA